MEILDTWYSTNKESYAVPYKHGKLVGILVFYDRKDYLNCLKELKMLSKGFYNYKNKEYREEILKTFHSLEGIDIIKSPEYKGDLTVLWDGIKFYIESMVFQKYWELADEHVESFKELSETVLLP